MLEPDVATDSTLNGTEAPTMPPTFTTDQVDDETSPLVVKRKPLDERPSSTQVPPVKKAAAKKATGKKVAKKKAAAPTTKSSGAPRRQRSFPAASFEDAMVIATVMQKLGTERARRLTIFEDLTRSADSGWSRQLVINSGRYGLTTGGMQAEWIQLTEDGKTATSPDSSQRDRLRARFRLAIESVQPFKELYEECVSKRFPSHSVLRDFLKDKGYDDAEVQECVDTFTVNARFLGLLKTVAGAERLLTVDHVLDSVGPEPRTDVLGAHVSTPATATSDVQHDWTTTCFYVTPIGDEDSEERRHSDLFMGALVEPALAEFGLTLVRADQIGKAGMITAQVIEHIVNSRLVIADLSFHNPNVFYEVALRHASRKAMVQLIRTADRIPFDLDQMRTIKVDTTDIYSLVPQIESYRSEISSQVRRALEGTSPVESPLTVFFPSFWDLVGASSN